MPFLRGYASRAVRLCVRCVLLIRSSPGARVSGAPVMHVMCLMRVMRHVVLRLVRVMRLNGCGQYFVS
jgi:hypothetical protein